MAGFPTGKQQSLRTNDREVALRLLEIKRQTAVDPANNHFMLKTGLAIHDPLLATRTWTAVMTQMQTHGKASAQNRCARAMKSKAFDWVRPIKLVETTVEIFYPSSTGKSVSRALPQATA